MDSFERLLLEHSPLASAVLEICDHIFDDEFLQSIWGKHHGRCYEDVLRFQDFLRLMRDALIHHGGSAHQLFVGLESRDAAPIDESNFYRKLARTPIELSRALLRECTGRLDALMIEPAVKTPHCFNRYELIIVDGKTIKNAAKRLKPTRGYIGKMLGAKALVAMNLRSGMAIAMSDSLDGMTNDVPLVPALMPQLYEVVGQRPIISVWDRQFDDLRTLGHLSSREGDAFVVRMKHKNMRFVAESAVKARDDQQREALDEIGVLGTGKSARRLRRITLRRDPVEGEDDVVLLTNLMERDCFSAADLLNLYRHRWKIEQVFQQVTETFSLSHLIGCRPQAVLLQFSFCLLLYNMMQVIKSFVAEDGNVPSIMISMFYLFNDVRTELIAWAYHTQGNWPQRNRTAAQLRARLRQLLRGSWNAVKYTKSADKKPRGKPPMKKWLKGGHTSIQRALEGRAKVAKRAKVVVS